MLINSPNILFVFVVYIIASLLYNVFAVLVIFTLSSVWHAILDNFRPITVWALDLLIFYCVNQALGESWTQYSYIQIIGMIVLLYGTAVYNAPNPGSVLLKGEWYSFGINCSREYDAIRMEQEKADGLASPLLRAKDSMFDDELNRDTKQLSQVTNETYVWNSLSSLEEEDEDESCLN
jgi:hypothetical protein